MQLTDVLCYALLMVTVATTYLQPVQSRQYNLEERRPDRRLNRRESSIFIDDFHNFDSGFQRPKIIYRRLSRQRYGPPKPRYGSARPKYMTTKPRNPIKKHRANPNTSHTKYGLPPQKKRAPVTRYGIPKRPSTKPYKPPKKTPSTYYFPRESVGFGEPPANYDHEPPKTTYWEPPTDSYGAPINAMDSYVAATKPHKYSSKYVGKTTDEPPPTGLSHPESSSHIETQDYGFDNEYQSWKNIQQNQNQHIDNEQSYTNKLSTFIIPDLDIYVTPSPENDEELNLNSYPENSNMKDNSKEEQSQKQKQKLKLKYNKSKKPQYFSDNKLLNRPWKGQKIPGPDHEIIVGGQYAEPPARYVPKYQSNGHIYESDDDFADMLSTSASSPYVNYKNSNLAFSPQNLNDAFSIVDK